MILEAVADERDGRCRERDAVGEAVFRTLGWNCPPCGFQVDVLSSHRADLAATLRCKQKQLERHGYIGSLRVESLPDLAHFLDGQNAIA